MALTDKLTAIGNAIREKNGTTDLIPLADMPQAILDILGGGESGSKYTSIVYNEDNTITLTDNDGVVHTITCTYDDYLKLVSVTYDGKDVPLTYEGDVLAKVGITNIDVTKAKDRGDSYDHTVLFTVQGEPYEAVYVKSGNKIRSPLTDPPDMADFIFGGWEHTNGDFFVEPYTVLENTVIKATNFSLSDLLRNSFGVNAEEYPSIHIKLDQTIQMNFYDMTILFLEPKPHEIQTITNGYTANGIKYAARLYHSNVSDVDLTNPRAFIKYLAENFPEDTFEYEDFVAVSGNHYGGVYDYTNFDCDFADKSAIGGGHEKDALHYLFD